MVLLAAAVVCSAPALLASPAAEASPARVTTAIAPSSAGFVTRSGSRLLLDGRPFRFLGVNEYYLGLDDNVRDAQGRPTYPPHERIDNALDGAVALGATVVRAHTLGISAGDPRSIHPTLSSWNDDAFESIDYAISAARARGLRLMVPLTDEWRFYHGGKSTFTGWRGYRNDPDTSRNVANDATQRATEAHFYTDSRVQADFRTYISHVLGHRNRYTGTTLSADPTIAIWETGNELWDAPVSWTSSVADYIKSRAPRQLVADGSAASGKHVADSAVDAPAVDIVGGHFYPRDQAWMHSDAAVAAAHGKAYVVGEFDWTGDLAPWLRELAADPAVSGGFLWALLPRLADGTPEPHDDGYAMWMPGTTTAMRAAQESVTATAKQLTAGWLAGATPSAAVGVSQWTLWASSGGTAELSSGTLRLRTGPVGGWSDKASARLAAPARTDGGVYVKLLPTSSAEGYLSVVLRGVGDSTSIADANGYRVEINAEGYASVQRRGSSPAALSSGIKIPGFAPGTAVLMEFSVVGQRLELRAWTGATRPVAPLWSGSDAGSSAVGGPGAAAVSLNGGRLADTPVEWRVLEWRTLT